MRPLTFEIKQELLGPFQAAEVRVRTHPYVAAYVTARVIQTRLDEVLPWQWSFVLTGAGVVDLNGVMHQDGEIVILQPDGPSLHFHDRGSAPPDIGKGQAKQAKHAVSDCFKRCAVLVGPARYLYELQGIQGGRVPKASLEKALAAVGYRGSWDDRHHGTIGGIREADLEDEDDAPGMPAMPAGDVGSGAGRSIKADAKQRLRIGEAVELTGGTADAPTFRGWLSKNTCNHATSLDDVLQEDVDELVRKLEELAARKSSA